MRDCSNGEVRDRLPELMHNQLAGETLALVRGHVEGCADCRAELALLEQLRSASVAPRVDTSRIVASLPRYRAVPAWRRVANAAPFRAAAAAVILLAGGYMFATRGGADYVPTARVAQPALPTPAATAHELAVGDSFTDLSDSDLAAMIDEMGTLEAVTPEAAEEPLLPIDDAGIGSGGDA
jgi:hypothetical protein